MIIATLLLAASMPTNCDAIKSMSTAKTTVTSAEVVPAGVFTAPAPPAARAGVAPRGRRQAARR